MRLHCARHTSKEGIVLPSPIRAPATSSTSTSSARLAGTQLREYLDRPADRQRDLLPLPLHLQDESRRPRLQAGDFPISETAADEVLALPMYPELREDEQETVVVEAIASFYA